MIGEGEHLGELRPEVAGAGIEVRLENHREFLVCIEFFHRCDDGADFFRMVGVVIDEDEVIAAYLVVEAPLHTRERLHPALDLRLGEPHQKPDGAGGSGVGDVVHPRNTDGEAVRFPVFFREGEAGGAGLHRHIADAIVARLPYPVNQFVRVRNQLRHFFVNDQKTIFINLVRKELERFYKMIPVAVNIQMVGIHRGDDGYVRV